MQLLTPRRFLTIVGAFLLALCGTAFGQGVTTSALNGTVLGKDGTPIAGVTVTAIHEPSGTKAATVTRSGGQYDFAGLRVGGPYTVSAAIPGGEALTQKDIFLELGQPRQIDFGGDAQLVKMEAITVTAERDVTFSSAQMSTSVNLNAADIGSIPTVRRDVQDIVNLDTRASLTPNTSTGELAVSVQGQNSRYNSFLIDGMQSNDTFGLNANGFSSLRSPIPLEAIAAFQIDLSPYGITNTGFTGAMINAVTKSGTNEFHGSVYTYYSGKTLRGSNPGTGPSDPKKGLRDQLQEHTYGFTFGGPLIKNKLFFFLAYEDYRRTVAAPGQLFVPDATVVAGIIDTAKSKWGYDAGTSSASDSKSAQKSYIAKIDWNITQDQRATFTYRRTDSITPNFADFNGATYTSLSNHWYEAHRLADNYIVQLNSNWTSDIRTDAALAYIKYDGTAKPYGARFPEVYINGVTGINASTGATIAGQIDMGTNYSYQLNALTTDNYNGHLYGEYSWGRHTFKVGGDFDQTKYDDQFVQYYYGRYAFASPAAFLAGTANASRYQQPVPGYTLDQTFARYSLTWYGAAVQDTWKPMSNLTILGGLRYEYPFIPSRPPFIGSFYNTFGYRNNTTGSGNATLQPRLGFSYTLPTTFLPKILGGRNTQIRGGIGLFRAANPAVWVANAFQTAGTVSSVYGNKKLSNGVYVDQTSFTLTTTGAAPVSASNPTGYVTFNPDPLYVQSLPPPAIPTPIVNVIDPSYKSPVSWKSNIGIDHTLPWLGMIASFDANFITVDRAIYLQSININPVGTEPDGRIRYNGNLHSNFSTVINMSNTDKGESKAYSFRIYRPLKNHWAFSAGYTRTYATEVQPLTSSVATSSYNYRATINPNEDTPRNSGYLTPDKFVVTATREFNFFGHANMETRVSAVFRAQTGHAYSWVFSGDANGDSVSGNDAFYVPTGPDDPKVTWANTAQRDAFFSFVAGSELRKHPGEIMAPNSSFNPWQHTIDLRFEQNVPLPGLHGRAKATAFLDCLNLANLVNKTWGITNGLDFGTSWNGYNRSVASATYTAATNTYAYTFTNSGTSPTLGSTTTFTELSRFQLQLGLKLAF